MQVTAEVYRDLQLHIATLPDAADTVVTVYAPGEDLRATGTFRVPFSPAETVDVLALIDRGTLDIDRAEHYGSTLFDALFRDQAVRQCYVQARHIQAPPVRLRLILDAPELESIPWELLFDTDRHTFVAAELPFVRSHSHTKPVQPLLAQPPLRVLVVAPSPAGIDAIDVAQNVNGLRRAFDQLQAHKQVRFQTATPPTISQLKNDLREAATGITGEIHILHFVGHGMVDPASGDPLLIFEDERGDVDLVTPDDFAAVAGSAGLRLVFLNGCHTAQSGIQESAHSFAHALMQRGIPAVIAMQTTIGAEMAVEVAGEFYAALADSQPVDRALLDARQVLGRSGRYGSGAIAVPVLYLRASDGRLLGSAQVAGVAEPSVRRRGWHALPVTATLGIVATLLGIIAALLTIYRDPLVATLLSPKQMTCSGVNIAVTEAGLREAGGHVTHSPGALGLSQQIYLALHERFGNCVPLDDPVLGQILVDVWPPDETGFVDGETVSERAKNAALAADRWEADLIIYGIVEAAERSTSFTPYILVSEETVSKIAEVAGSYPFGAPLIEDGVFASPTTRSALASALAQRIPDVVNFVIGLDYFAKDKYDAACRQFKAMLSTASSGTPDDGCSYVAASNVIANDLQPAEQAAAGDELAYLFLGHAARRQGDPDSAQHHYEAALAVNPGYARALLSLADLQYMAAAGTCQPNNCDKEGVRAAIEAFQTVPATDDVEYANIPAKKSYAVGRAYACLAMAGEPENRSSATASLEQVIAAYDAGDKRLAFFAAEAQQLIGLLLTATTGAQRPADLAAADARFATAIELSTSDERKAVFYLHRAEIQAALGHCDAAARHLDTAEDMASHVPTTKATFDAFLGEAQAVVAACQD